MKKQHLKLTETDERYLTELLSKGQAQARVVRRATALLQLNQGVTLQFVADTREGSTLDGFDVAQQVSEKWFRLFGGAAKNGSSHRN